MDAQVVFDGCQKTHQRKFIIGDQRMFYKPINGCEEQ